MQWQSTANSALDLQRANGYQVYQEELERFDGVDAGKYTAGLGQVSEP